MLDAFSFVDALMWDVFGSVADFTVLERAGLFFTVTLGASGYQQEGNHLGYA
jgi:hypothetical protein